MRNVRLAPLTAGFELKINKKILKKATKNNTKWHLYQFWAAHYIKYLFYVSVYGVGTVYLRFQESVKAYK